MTNRARKNLTISFSILIIFLFLSNMLFIVNETEVAVIARFGRILNKIAMPGLHIKLPWPIDEALLIDKRYLSFQIPEISPLTLDQKNIIVHTYLVWQIVNPKVFVETIRYKNIAESRLSDLTEARLGAEIGQIPLFSFINPEVGSDTFTLLNRKVTQSINNIVVTKFGIKLLNLNIIKFTFPYQNQPSIIARMIADRNSVAEAFRAKGEENALRIQGEAIAEHNRILGDAHAKSEAIIGIGEAKALSILANAYNQDPAFYRFIRALESYESIIGKNSTIFLRSDSNLLKQLDNEQGNNANTTQK